MLDAAMQCFARQGYDGTRVKHIAERAGVSDGALYRHFHSKEELAQRLYAQTMGTYSRMLQEAAQASDSIRRRLEGCLKAGLALYRANPDAMTFAVLRQHTFMPNLPKDFLFPIQIVEGVVREGQEKAEIRAGDPKLLAAIYSGCLLRPIIVSQLAATGSFDLLNDTSQDNVILDAAWAALER